MTPAEAATLLALAAAYDNRKASEAAAKEWALALHDVALADAIQAARAHYAATTDYLLVAHVRQGVKRIRAQRITDTAAIEPPDADPDDVPGYLAALRRINTTIASGQPTPQRQAITTSRAPDHARTFRRPA